MKVFVSLLTAALLGAQPVLAADVSVSDNSSREEVSSIFELEEGPMSYTDLQSLMNGADATTFSTDPGAEDVIGAIIGGIIGAIAANALEKDHRYKNREVTCFAKNRRGEVFRAHGKRPRAVQARAMDKCYRDSRFCREAGCRVR